MKVYRPARPVGVFAAAATWSFRRRLAVLLVLVALASFALAPVPGYADTGQPPFLYFLILPETGATSSYSAALGQANSSVSQAGIS
jgi:hypothetical protein